MLNNPAIHKKADLIKYFDYYINKTIAVIKAYM